MTGKELSKIWWDTYMATSPQSDGDNSNRERAAWDAVAAEVNKRTGRPTAGPDPFRDPEDALA